MYVFAFYGRFIVLCFMFHPHLPLLMSFIARIIFVLRQFQRFFYFQQFIISRPQSDIYVYDDIYVLIYHQEL